jgi:malonyl-CoA/methylmalonyl-CoA synthetase
LWGIWRAGGIAVPLAVSHPPPELDYVLADADIAGIITDAELDPRIRPLAEARGLPIFGAAELRGGHTVGSRHERLPVLRAGDGALLVYTSGTTSKPKGVLLTHGNLEAQIRSLQQAWAWSERDHILCALPLHHLHGIVNVLLCALHSGARCTIRARFDAEDVCDVISDGDFTLFMAVPTMYNRLISVWEASDVHRRERFSAACRRMRLMVSGSAALPVSVLERWREISGHTLLERYGMTEIGMALSNPLAGTRRPGFVGTPLPGVEVRLVDGDGREVPSGETGEIEVRGPNVFREYWNRPDATADAFRDGWFRTGDVALVEGGSFRILGRSSVDIIKTGGYKVSALEIEEVLRTHEAVADCAVVGVPDETWGERVCAAVVPRPGQRLDPEGLRTWARERLAPYKVPSHAKLVRDLPRNAVGKVIKPEVALLFGTTGT